MLIPQIPFSALDESQIDVRWVESGYGLEAHIFDGHSFQDPGYLRTFSQTLSFAKSLDPTLLTLHFPTDHADYINDERIKKHLYEFIEMAIKYEIKGITIHANQFMDVEQFQSCKLEELREKIVGFFSRLDEELKGTDVWIGIENLPIIGNMGDDFDPIFIYPEDFKEISELHFNKIGITWDICHWAITYLTRLSISKLLRDPQQEYVDFHQYLQLWDCIKHFHFSSFKHLTIPYSQVPCYEGQHPSLGSIDERILRETLTHVKKKASDSDMGIVFEVQEKDYSKRVRAWETLKWFEGV